jgi:hypothetical protein
MVALLVYTNGAERLTRRFLWVIPERQNVKYYSIETLDFVNQLRIACQGKNEKFLVAKSPPPFLDTARPGNLSRLAEAGRDRRRKASEKKRAASLSEAARL